MKRGNSVVVPGAKVDRGNAKDGKQSQYSGMES